MRLRNVKNAKSLIDNSPLVVTKNPFTTEKPLHIEIGCGKGDFLINMALKYPNINFIGIEKYESVLIRALEKITEIPSNLRFMNLLAEGIEDQLNHEIDVIYLNFSDPWPKKRHAKRRLTSDLFLKKYESIVKEKVEIIQKTDNKSLFAYSIINYNNFGYKIKELSLDLTNSGIENIMTEYEKKFVSQGILINYIHVVKDISKR